MNRVQLDDDVGGDDSNFVAGKAVHIVDGGALSWSYGLIDPLAWEAVKSTYSRATICLDSPWSARQEAFPDYKSRRADRRASDPRVAERREQARDFKDKIAADEQLFCWEKEGWEADDLVAILYLEARSMGESTRVYAVDKDLVQLPGIHRCLYNFDASERDIDLFQTPRKQPKFWGGTRDNRDVLLFQLCFGDKTDSIPRLLAHLDFGTVHNLKKVENPFWTAYQKWGQPVIDSLLQLVMPSPILHRSWETLKDNPEVFLFQLDSTLYWSHHNFSHHIPAQVLPRLSTRA